MFDCECSCDYDDGAPEFFDCRISKARKEHICCECNRIIKKGEKYKVDVGKFEGNFYSFKTCSTCTQIREDFNSCAAFGELWDSLRDCWGEDADLLGV